MIYLLYFLYFYKRQNIKKILYDKDVPTLAIRDRHNNNHFTNKFVFLCHVNYFINDDSQRLDIFIALFIPAGIKFYIFICVEHIC